MSPAPDRLKASTWLAILITLLAWAAFSFVPGWRVWGLGLLSPLPHTERAVVVGLAIILCVLVWFVFARRWERSGQEMGGPTIRPLWFALGALALFVALLDRTHFLGDGVARLESLASLKIRGGLEFRLLQPIAKGVAAVWGEPNGALRAYQLLTVLCGGACAWLVAHYSWKIFESGYRALAFALGMLTISAMLVFFGFVGDQALLVLATFTFVCAGTACLKDKASVWGAVIAFLVAVLARPLGWCLLPPLLFLLVAKRSTGSVWKRAGYWLKVALCVGAAGGFLFFLVRLYTTQAGFRISLVPLFRDRLTVHGYTLFSLPHVADVLNLLLFLFPALLVAFVFMKGVRREPGDSALIFLVVTTVFAWLAVFCMDPHLGMPRSWDRLALAGVPLSAWLYYRLLSRPSPRGVTAAFLCASVSLTALLGRAWVQTQPEPAVRAAMGYFALDPARSRTGVIAVGKYLLERNTTSIYGQLEDFRRQNYPEEAMREQLNFHFRDNKQREAAALCQEVIRRDPRISSPWLFIGYILNNMGHFDSAITYLVVADGLDPHNPQTLNEMGRAYYFEGDRDRAVGLWLESLEEDSLQYVPQLALATYYRELGEAAVATEWLTRAASRPDAPADTYLELARDHAEGKRLSEARAAFETAMQRGADSSKVALLLKDFPGLAPAPPAIGVAPAPAPTP